MFLPGKIWLVLLALFICSFADAGTYAVSYSGGHWSYVDTYGGHSSGDDYMQNGYAYWWVADVTTTQTELSGAITAKFTWQPSYPGEPTPSSVLVTEEVFTSANPGYSTTSLPNEYIDVGSYVHYWEASAQRFQIKTNPGQTFNIPSCSPTAYTQGSGSHYREASIYYQAQADSGITTSGGITDALTVTDPDTSVPTSLPQGLRKYLIGQKVTAQCKPYNLTGTSYNWAVSGGDPFGAWNPTVNVATLPTPLSATSTNLACYFKKPMAQPESRATISVNVTLNLPDYSCAIQNGTTSTASTLPASFSEKVYVTRPYGMSFRCKSRNYTDTNNRSGYPDVAQSTPDKLIPDNGIGSNPYPPSGVGIYYNPFITKLSFRGTFFKYDDPMDTGISWYASVKTVTPGTVNPWGESSDVGYWNMVQTVTPRRTRVISGSPEQHTQQNLLVLDTPLTDYWAYDPPYKPVSGDPHYAYPADGDFYNNPDDSSNPKIVHGDAPVADRPGIGLLISGLTSVMAGDTTPSPTDPSKPTQWEEFSMYLMYMPPGSDSVFVPLLVTNWRWVGKATSSNGVFTSSGCDSQVDALGKYPAFPSWTAKNLNTFGP